MSWFADLTPHEYARAEATVPPTLNVGWLSREYLDYPRGATSEAFVVRLAFIIEHAPTRVMRGSQFCELCPDQKVESSHEIRAVGADGTRYAAPMLIHHYATAHAYQPPQVFVDAVLRGPSLDVEHARANNLCLSCGNALIVGERYDDLLRGPERIPVYLIEFECPACAVDYARSWPR
jgi:hypothetical protein